MQDIQQRVGERIRKLRSDRGYSQESFADACALHRTYMGSVERGERNMTLKTIFTICRTLKITPAELLEGMR
jgi:transcriptional regulator with XRE-family HTH domain